MTPKKCQQPLEIPQQSATKVVLDQPGGGLRKDHLASMNDGPNPGTTIYRVAVVIVVA